MRLVLAHRTQYNAGLLLCFIPLCPCFLYIYLSLSVHIQTTSRILLLQLKAHFAEVPRGRLIQQHQSCTNYRRGNCTQFQLIAGHAGEMWHNLFCVQFHQPRCWFEIDHGTCTFFFCQSSCVVPVAATKVVGSAPDPWSLLLYRWWAHKRAWAVQRCVICYCWWINAD